MQRGASGKVNGGNIRIIAGEFRKHRIVAQVNFGDAVAVRHFPILIFAAKALQLRKHGNVQRGEAVVGAVNLRNMGIGAEIETLKPVAAQRKRAELGKPRKVDLPEVFVVANPEKIKAAASGKVDGLKLIIKCGNQKQIRTVGNVQSFDTGADEAHAPEHFSAGKVKFPHRPDFIGNVALNGKMRRKVRIKYGEPAVLRPSDGNPCFGIVRIIVRPKLRAVFNAVGIGSFKKAQRGVKVVFVIEFGVCGRLFGGKFGRGAVCRASRGAFVKAGELFGRRISRLCGNAAVLCGEQRKNGCNEGDGRR